MFNYLSLCDLIVALRCIRLFLCSNVVQRTTNKNVKHPNNSMFLLYNLLPFKYYWRGCFSCSFYQINRKICHHFHLFAFSFDSSLVYVTVKFQFFVSTAKLKFNLICFVLWTIQKMFGSSISFSFCKQGMNFRFEIISLPLRSVSIYWYALAICCFVSFVINFCSLLSISAFCWISRSKSKQHTNEHKIVHTCNACIPYELSV